MAELKTKPNELNVRDYLNSISDEQKKKDCFEVLEMMQKIIGEPPKMWGSDIIGFGQYHYVYQSGREGDWLLTGFSPRKQYLSVYIMSGLSQHQELLSQLGKFKNGKSCLNIKSLDDVDREKLSELIRSSVAYMKRTYPS